MNTTWPLSVWQRFMVNGERRRPGRATDPWFTVNAVLLVEGALDLRILAAAADDLVARHDLLRARVDLDTGTQVVEDSLPASVELLDGWSGAAEELLHHPVPVATGSSPLVLRVVRRSSHEHLLAAHLHHLFGDPVTLWRILRDLGDLYAARCGAPSPPPPTGQYGEYAAHEAAVAGAYEAEAGRWWRDALADVALATASATARDAPFAVRRPVLSGDDLARLEAWARARRSTLFAGLLAVLTERMAAHVVAGTGDHLLFNTLFERRDGPRWRTMAGPCLAPSYVAVPLTATADPHAVALALSAAVRYSRYPTWTLDRVTRGSVNFATFVPFVELIPQLRPDTIPFGPASAVVAAAAGERDSGETSFLGLRFRRDTDGSLVAHVRGDGVGWTGQAVRTVLDGMPAGVRAVAGVRSAG
ncbi:condensation domain-containing protein [Micromonospora sp. NBC_01699]|uniref:condensation domain-containing protein n=1 Tax=Micromonospora sp. NBC_01699 TaxID=2975984 RepID=UPI002E33F180|nr:condensation domain-containing protein [Micromonospora sp. NBC_01699]